MIKTIYQEDYVKLAEQKKKEKFLIEFNKYYEVEKNGLSITARKMGMSWMALRNLVFKYNIRLRDRQLAYAVRREKTHERKLQERLAKSVMGRVRISNLKKKWWQDYREKLKRLEYLEKRVKELEK